MPGATLILKNARIFTVDPGRPWAQAMAVRGDGIIAVGDEDEVLRLSGADAATIDAGGRLVLPGFIDGHIHTSMAHEEAFRAGLGSERSFEEISATVRRFAQEHPEKDIVAGTGWTYDAVRVDGDYPTKEMLDGVVGDRPLLLVSYDGWVALGNTLLTDLAVAEFDRSEHDLGGVVRHPGTGEPTGVFHNPGDLMFHAGDLSRRIRESEFDGLRWVYERLPRYGITGVHDAHSDFLSLEAYQKLRDEGGLKARTYIALNCDETTTDEDLRGFAESRDRFSDEWLRAGVVKLFLDGVLDSHTAALLEPYADDPDSRGSTLFDPDEFKDIVAKLDGLGFQCMTHSCGDRGVRVALDAYEHARKVNGPRDSRHRIEHIELVSEEDMPRFKELGVIASMQPIHAVPTEDKALSRAAGPGRMRTSYPWRSLDRAGARLAFSSDWPVADMNPMVGIHAAVAADTGFGRRQTVSLEKAIQAYTINEAYASFEEDIKGSLEVGKLADFVVLSKDLFDCAPEDIRECEVLLTVLGGMEVYRAGSF
jgi:predicted amidohydrolase YtcJ